MTTPLDNTKTAGSPGTSGQTAGDPTPRPRYERPRITFQEALEVMALVCTPGKTNLGNCSRGPISS